MVVASREIESLTKQNAATPPQHEGVAAYPFLQQRYKESLNGNTF